ncbi:MAG: DUF1998 domain-containing protein, partial [Bacteroidota bacterium]
IVETREGSILVEPFNNWRFFKENNNREWKYIEDERFLKRLKLWFENLENLVEVPQNKIENFYEVDKRNNTIAASYFPKWMFCPTCKRFDHLDNWLKKWKNETGNNEYHPPKCYHCYHNKKGKRKLEQIRFILTSPSGNIADILWDKWVFCQQKKSDSEEVSEDEKGIKKLDFDREPPKNVFYEYITSDKFNNLTGISIVAKDIETNKVIKRATLSGLFSLRVPEFCVIDNNSKTMMKTAIRSSNSVYYPNILQSLQLPKKYNNQANTESEYRLSEFRFITQIKEGYDDGFLTIEKLNQDLLSGIKLKHIYRLDSLKMTSVQVSYTRQEPIDKDFYLQEDSPEQRNQGQLIKKQYTSAYGTNTKYLPAIENVGEGIFFEFDKDLIDKWTKENPDLYERAKVIQENYDNTKLSPNEYRNISPKYLLIHTFSHILIKELEFLSGYPATSLQERLYIDADMQGVLIYTIAGAEGSYGGLVSLCDEDDCKINQLIESALERATDCSADPICENTDLNGQGVGGTNLAACYSCALLPETSCEEFNRFLDRKTLHSFFEV